LNGVVRVPSRTFSFGESVLLKLGGSPGVEFAIRLAKGGLDGTGLSLIILSVELILLCPGVF
jgi:hypothetical protein